MNIEEFLQEHNIEFRRHGEHHHVSSGWINTDCPQCSPNSKHFRLGWNLRGGYFSCWSCGKLPTLSTLQALTNLPIKTIRETIGGLEKSDFYENQRPPGKLELPASIGGLLPAHISYLFKRGFNIHELETLWKIRGIDWTNPKLAWRIFIPIKLDGETISWTTRSVDNKNPRRYITANAEQEKFPAKQILYGVDYCQHSIIICEGPLDVWKIGLGAVATMGTAYTKAQMLMASRFTNRFICFDNDKPGQEAAQKLCKDLMMFPGTTKNVILSSGKDPGEADKDEIQQLQELLI